MIKNKIIKEKNGRLNREEKGVLFFETAEKITKSIKNKNV